MSKVARPKTGGAWWLALSLYCAFPFAVAQAQALPGTSVSLRAWLERVNQASRQSVYTGTFVVSSGGGFSSARVWHVCKGDDQLERVETLSGAPRIVIRRNDEVLTLFPKIRLAVTQTQATSSLFTHILANSDDSIGRHYTLRWVGYGRHAGFDAEIVHLQPLDPYRWSQRIWSELQTGLILQWQTINPQGVVLEQAAFSELRLNAPIDAQQLEQAASLEGYRVQAAEMQRVPEHETVEWTPMNPVAGFRPVARYRRQPAPGGTSRNEANLTQWIFSDGVATISLFVEPFDAKKHRVEGATALGGASHSRTRRMQDRWITAVGEVPPQTLEQLVRALEFQKSVTR